MELIMSGKWVWRCVCGVNYVWRMRQAVYVELIMSAEGVWRCVCGVNYVWRMRLALYVELIMSGKWVWRCVCGVNFVWRKRLAVHVELIMSRGWGWRLIFGIRSGEWSKRYMRSKLCQEDDTGGIYWVRYVCKNRQAVHTETKMGLLLRQLKSTHFPKCIIITFWRL